MTRTRDRVILAPVSVIVVIYHLYITGAESSSSNTRTKGRLVLIRFCQAQSIIPAYTVVPLPRRSRRTIDVWSYRVSNRSRARQQAACSPLSSGQSTQLSGERGGQAAQLRRIASKQDLPSQMDLTSRTSQRRAALSTKPYRHVAAYLDGIPSLWR
jgi:hypothetical protein